LASDAVSARRLAHAIASQIDPVGVVDDPVEDRVGERRNPDHVVPAVDRNLAGDDERALVIAVFDDFEQIARLFGRQGFGPPVVQNKQLGACDRA